MWVMEVALMDLGFIALYQGEYRAAHNHFADCLAATRTAGHRINEALALNLLGWVATLQADYATARIRREESLALARAVADSWAISVALGALGHALLRQSELTAARRLLEEGVALQRQIGERFMLAYTLDALGQLATAEGHFAEARTALRESLRLREDMGDPVGTAESLESIAALAATQKEPERAIELAGAAAGLRQAMGAPLHPMHMAVRDEWLVPLRKRFGEEAATRQWEAGQATPVDKAVELALAVTEAPPPQPDRAPELSPREREVAALLAEGLSNRQIAERLVVTERTVAAHIEHILNKLGFASRHQVGAWAADHGLVT
jgi:non-specific serine/threonine protein kinase